MSFSNIDPYDFFRRFFGSSRGNIGKIDSSGARQGEWNRRDFFREFDDMQREMERMFEEQFGDIQSKAPKELVREYQTPEGEKVREVGPIVYGYSMTIGPDGKPHVREFGNVKSLGGAGLGGIKPQILPEREPLADVNTTDNEVKVILEMPGIKKEDIKINAYESKVEVKTEDRSQRKYQKTLDLPKEADIETAKSVYNNGILEVTFDKKKETKPKGKEIKIE
jgi:HSP20 family protein